MLQLAVGVGGQRCRRAVFTAAENQLRLRLPHIAKALVSGGLQAESPAIGLETALELAIPETNAHHPIPLLGFDIQSRPFFQLLAAWLRRLGGGRRNDGTERGRKIDVGDLSTECAWIRARQIAQHRNGKMLVRKSDQIGPVTGIRTGMGNDIEAAIFSDLEAGRVAELRAVVERSALLQLVDQRLSTDAGGVEVLIPKRQIPHRRQKAGRAHRIEIRDAEFEAIVARGVAIGRLLDNFGMVVAEVRLRHAERREQARAGIGAKRLAADPLHHLRQQRIAGIGIEMFRARREIERLLPRQDRQNIGVRDQVERITPAGQRQQLPLVAQAAGVMN